MDSREAFWPGLSGVSAPLHMRYPARATAQRTRAPTSTPRTGLPFGPWRARSSSTILVMDAAFLVGSRTAWLSEPTRHSGSGSWPSGRARPVRVEAGPILPFGKLQHSDLSGAHSSRLPRLWRGKPGPLSRRHRPLVLHHVTGIQLPVLPLFSRPTIWRRERGRNRAFEEVGRRARRGSPSQAPHRIDLPSLFFAALAFLGSSDVSRRRHARFPHQP